MAPHTMNSSRLNVLTKRQTKAKDTGLQYEYSSFRGSIGFLVFLLSFIVFPSFDDSKSIFNMILAILGYGISILSALFVIMCLYVGVVRQLSYVELQKETPNSSKETSANGLRQRKFAVPDVQDFQPSATQVKSSSSIISTEEELLALQPHTNMNSEEGDSKLNFGFGMEMSSAINPNGLYSQSYTVMKPTAKPPARKELESALSSAPHVDKAHEVLAECRLKPRHVGNLCDKLRHVLAQHLQDVLGNLNQNMEELMKLGIRRDILVDFSAQQSVVSIQVPGESTPRMLHNISMKNLLHMCRAEPIFASKTRPNVHLLREYETLMKYFDVKEEYSTAYAIHRLETLGEDGFLGPYRWDSGGKWKGKTWSKDSMLPSDAELIMNLFCAMLDDVLPATCDSDRPFRRGHYAPSPPTKSASIRGMFLIFCSQIVPPNFKIIANGTVWEILPGKTNVFQAIVLFLYAVKQFKSGHLGNINLHVLLEEIFEN